MNIKTRTQYETRLKQVGGVWRTTRPGTYRTLTIRRRRSKGNCFGVYYLCGDENWYRVGRFLPHATPEEVAHDLTEAGYVEGADARDE